MMTRQQMANKIIDNIIYDLTDRRGLKQEYQQIDEETKKELIETWRGLVLEVLERESA